MNELTQARRYARHTVLPDIGEAGQRRLGDSSMLIIGAGGLGAQAAASLAAMGVGRIGLVDDDRVELSNLQRQTLYETADIGRLKVEAARDRLNEMNDEVRIEPHVLRLDAGNARALVAGYEMVLDGTDNFASRFAVAEACLHEKKPLISAAITGFDAQLSVFKPYLGAPHPCYRCLVPEVPPRERNCAQEGVLGALAGVMGSLMAVEAVKECLSLGTSLSGQVLLYNALAGGFRRVLLSRDEECVLCAGC